MIIILVLPKAGNEGFAMGVPKPVASFMAMCEQTDLTLTLKTLVYSKADPPKSF